MREVKREKLRCKERNTNEEEETKDDGKENM